VVLAGGVALVELPCTAGFPVIWSDLVNAAGVSGPEFAALLGIYLSVYLLDELVVFGAAIITMRATRLEERHGRALKLVGGMLMIAIGITIVTVPDALDTVGGLLAVFAAARPPGRVRRCDRRQRPGGGPGPGPATRRRPRPHRFLVRRAKGAAPSRRIQERAHDLPYRR
jgi:hypothetical protein